MTLPMGWAEPSFAEIARQRSGNGKLIKGKLQSEPLQGSFPAFSASGQDVWRDGYEYEGDAIIVSAVGARCGKAFRASGRWSAIANTHVVVPDHDAVDTDFLFRILNDENFWVKGGTAQPFVKVGATFEKSVPLPPIAEQRRIIAKLDALTARLARARAELDRVPNLSEKQHLSILRAGVRGELSADWRESNRAEPVSSALSRVPAPQQGRGGREATDKVIPGVAGLSVNNPGTELPGDWAWTPLLRIAKQETGHTPSRSKPEYWDGRVPWIGIRDAGAHHGHYINDTAQTISEVGLANSSARLLPTGTVCLSRTASVGYVTIMARPMSTSQDFATWTCSEALLPEYLMYALMAEGEEIRNFGMGTTHTTIYFPEVRAFHIALPPIDEQKEIVARIKTGLASAYRLEAEATSARALLDRLESALLAKAFRGELVPQDPSDEPAQTLLDRIRNQRANEPKAKRGRRKAQLEHTNA